MDSAPSIFSALCRNARLYQRRWDAWLAPCPRCGLRQSQLAPECASRLCLEGTSHCTGTASRNQRRGFSNSPARKAGAGSSAWKDKPSTECISEGHQDMGCSAAGNKRRSSALTRGRQSLCLCAAAGNTGMRRWTNKPVERMAAGGRCSRFRAGGAAATAHFLRSEQVSVLNGP